ncbi:hypothetical protein EBZ35_07665 [bacterium]|nr:hypothetical protein [bacterium]
MLPKRFQRWALVTWISTLGLVMIGSFVRASGSGLGCPDWPTCFGQWIPPTHVSQLPADYQTHYAHLDSVVFNPLKTWVEYLNRLAGVIVGLLALSLAGWAVLARRQLAKGVPLLCGIILAAISVQGWIGAKVVSSDLAPYMISIHMVMATWIVVMQGIVVALSTPAESCRPTPLYGLYAMAALIQWVGGLRVRQGVDHGISLQSMGNPLYFHLLMGIWVLIVGWRWGSHLGRRPLRYVLWGMLAGQFITGAWFYGVGLTQWLQPIHLMGGILAIGIVAYWSTRLWQSSRISHPSPEPR